MRKLLETTIEFLDQVEVCGKKNLTRLLAAIHNLEGLKAAFEQGEKKETEGKEENGNSEHAVL